MATVYLNNEPIEVAEQSTLAQVLERVDTPAQPYAVAVNADFVPRSRYGETPVAEGDRIELVVATQGG